MTSTTVGLPDRYRPIEQIGPDEPTGTGVISTWRAKDRVLNRDVAIRVHTPGGPAAHSWISRALTAGGLATPALAMVYDASEGTADPQGPGGVAYVVNEWIDGEALADRLTRGPLPERDARTVMRRLAEGVAEAHRVGLAVGGLTAGNVVLRPNGLVGLRGVPAAVGTVDGDIAALGVLLEYCLTGRDPDSDGAPAARAALSPDLGALVRRARSTEPGRGLTSAAAMAALLSERPRVGSTRSESLRSSGPDSGRQRRLAARDEAPAVAGPPEPTIATDLPPAQMDPHAMPPVPPTRPVVPLSDGSWPADDRVPGPATPGYSTPGYSTPGYAFDTPGGHVLGDGALADDAVDDDALDEPAGLQEPTARRRLVVYGVPILALAVVIGLAVWLGSSVLSVANDVTEVHGSTPQNTTQSSSSAASKPTAGKNLPIVGATVFDPEGDGQPDNARTVDQSHDGDPATAWATVDYRGSAKFGNLKSGEGVLYDLGSAQPLAGVTVTTTMAGSTAEIRTGSTPDGPLDSYAVQGTATLDGTTKVQFSKPVTARYVLVWITTLVPSDGGFAANLAEVSVQHAG
jgi:eukaryotic-like serine/threonine-protein kinase